MSKPVTRWAGPSSAPRSRSSVLSQPHHFSLVSSVACEKGPPSRAFLDSTSALRLARIVSATFRSRRPVLSRVSFPPAFLYLSRMALAGERAPSHFKAALAYIEQAKSRTLADLMAFRAPRPAGPGPAHRGLVEQFHRCARS